MARHSNGQDNYRVAGWVIAVAVAVVVAIVALIIYLLAGNNDSGEDTNAAAESSSEAEVTDEAAAEESSVVESTGESEDESEAESTAVEESEEPEASEEETTSEQPAAPAIEAADTLILLDTSNGMADRFEPVTGALADTARALSGTGQSVALWNYSSPLNPGVTVGFRDNLGFGDGEAAANTITNFGTGGVPQSRSAVVAAVDTAADRAADTGSTARVLLVTTGTEGDMDDAGFTQAFEQAAGGNVELSVVHVGPGEPDAAIKGLADSFEAVEGTDRAAVASALQEAAGA